MPVTVGKTGDAPVGEITEFEVEGAAIAIANVEGRFYALDDTCTHAGCSLAMGYLEGTTVTCLCHSSEFDVTTGAVLSGPAEQPARSYQVQVDGDDLQIKIELRSA